MRRILLALALFLVPQLALGQQPVSHGTGARATAAWTSATSIDTALTVPTVGMSVANITLNPTSTFSAGTLNFEASDDGGTTYYPVAVTRFATYNTDTNYVIIASTKNAWSVNVSGFTNFRVRINPAITGSGTANVAITPIAAASEPDIVVGQAQASMLNGTFQGPGSVNGAAATTNRVGTLDCVVQTDPANGAAYTQGRDAGPDCGTDGSLWTSIRPALRPASYVASSKFAGSSTTDNSVMPGNATNTVLVTRVMVSCTQTTAGNVALSVVKRSAADTAGTSAGMTAVPDDSTFSAASSAPLSYTGTGPSVGTPVGNVDTYQLGCNAAATASPNDIYILDRRLKPIVLRGTAQQLGINFGGAITGGNLTVTYEWQEIKTITP